MSVAAGADALDALAHTRDMLDSGDTCWGRQFFIGFSGEVDKARKVAVICNRVIGTRGRYDRHIERIEREIEGLDSRVNEIELLFESPETYTDAARSWALSEELAELKMRSRERVLQWEALLHQLEAMTAS